MTLKDLSLEGKTALVTGASRGLGKGIALALAEAGANLALAARSIEPLKETAKAAREMGREAQPLVMDAANLSEVEAAVRKTVERFGRLDILVNAAGTQVRKPALEITEEDWDKVLSINLKAVFFCCQAAGRVMIPQGKGKIINFASLTSVLGIPNICAYGASKGGISQMTKGLAVEWAKYHINVNCLGPGYFRTELTAAVFDDPERRAVILSRIPLGRSGLPEDLAGAAIFLASDASDYVTGQTIFVDGGWLSA